MEMDMTKTVLVLGANGNFGSHAAKAFAAAGWEVRRYERGTDMVAAAQGVDVIVNGLNPPSYHNWKKFIPEITAQVIAAGLASGATVMVPGNVYVYGDQPGPWGPDTPQRPASRKGAIRVEMERSYREAAEKGLQTIILRGGDFLDPASKSSIMSLVVLKSLAKGVVTAPGEPSGPPRLCLPARHGPGDGGTGRDARHPARLCRYPLCRLFLFGGGVARQVAGAVGPPDEAGAFCLAAGAAAATLLGTGARTCRDAHLYDTPHSLDPAPLAALLPDFRVTPLDAIIAGHLPPGSRRRGRWTCSGQREVHPDRVVT